MLFLFCKQFRHSLCFFFVEFLFLSVLNRIINDSGFSLLLSFPQVLSLPTKRVVELNQTLFCQLYLAFFSDFLGIHRPYDKTTALPKCLPLRQPRFKLSFGLGQSSTRLCSNLTSLFTHVRTFMSAGFKQPHALSFANL